MAELFCSSPYIHTLGTKQERFYRAHQISQDSVQIQSLVIFNIQLISEQKGKRTSKSDIQVDTFQPNPMFNRIGIKLELLFF